jgi:hypothetical protein
MCGIKWAAVSGKEHGAAITVEGNDDKCRRRPQAPLTPKSRVKVKAAILAQLSVTEGASGSAASSCRTATASTIAPPLVQDRQQLIVTGSILHLPSFCADLKELVVVLCVRFSFLVLCFGFSFWF